MDSLPNELLSYILYLGLPPMRAISNREDAELMVVGKPGPVRAYLSNTGLVCKRWQDVVILTPILWSMIYFGRIDSNDRKDALGIFQTFLQRSKNAPIHVEIDLPQHWKHGSDLYAPSIGDVQLELRQHSGRIRSLVLSYPPQDIWPVGGTWDALEAVEVDGLEGQPSFDVWPSLLSLAVQCNSLDDLIALENPDVFPAVSCASLKNLIWTGPYFPSSASVAECASSLNYLAFDRVEWTYQGPNGSTNVDIPHVKFTGISNILPSALPIFSANVRHLFISVPRIVDLTQLPDMFPRLLSLEVRYSHTHILPYRFPEGSSVLLKVAPQLRAYSILGVMDYNHVRTIWGNFHSPTHPVNDQPGGGVTEEAPCLRLLRMQDTHTLPFGHSKISLEHQSYSLANKVTKAAVNRSSVMRDYFNISSLMREVLSHRSQLIMEIVGSWRTETGRDAYDVYSSVAKEFPGRLLLEDAENFVTTVDTPEYLIHRSEAWDDFQNERVHAKYDRGLTAS